MERERGRASRASSTTSLGREVRCGCQFYQSDSLLPERQALVGRPPSRTAMQTPPPLDTARCEHEYEPIATPPPPTITAIAPVVRITDTDVAPVADSDDSIDVQRRFSPIPTLDSDVVLPLDGRIEDSAMEGRELGETVDTSEDQETAQQLQDRLEERFLNAATPGTESRTDGEVNTSQVDSSALEELPLRRGARGLPQRLRSQAGKLRSRLRGIQRPTFSLPERQRPEKTKTAKTVKAEKPGKSERRASRMDRLKFSLPDRPKFNLPERPKFRLPERPKFNMPERPKFNMPERPRFTMPERPKFSIKRPNIHMPSFSRARKPPRERPVATESSSGSRRNIFDFSTYPRIFDKKSKNRGEYATSSPKESRAQSAESATFPRARKKAPPLGARWTQRFTDLKFADDEAKTVAESATPWRHPSLEEPRLARRQESAEEEPEKLPWEDSGDRDDSPVPIEDVPYEVEDDSNEATHHRDLPELERAYVVQSAHLHEGLKGEEDSFEAGPEEAIDPRLYGDREVEPTLYRSDAEDAEEIHEPDSYEKHDSAEIGHDHGYDDSHFRPIDPRKYGRRVPSSERGSYQSDKEQQSSGSSCDRRRRGVLEEIDSDEFFLRQKGISQDDMNVGRYLTSEIRDALRSPANALADEINQENEEVVVVPPPTRPARTRSFRKRKDDSVESYHAVTPPARPKRDRRRSEESDCENFYRDKTGSLSGSRHRIIYQTEAPPRSIEPLDDIVVVKPARRKSRASTRSQSQMRSESLEPSAVPAPPTPPVAPRRRKRARREIELPREREAPPAVCNGHSEWEARVGAKYPPEVGAARVEEPPAENRETFQTLVMRLEEEYIESAPIAPKRASRSRATSVADDDRTSRGAESLPELSYADDDAPRDTDSRDLPGYAIIEKRDKPPRPPPPRRRRDKFATAPARPHRSYSTVGPIKSHSQNQLNVTPYTEVESDEGDEHRDLRSGEVLSKMQGRPLPAPPRPPRARREQPPLQPEPDIAPETVAEAFASTQTDPLPDDLVIEEEITQAKLVMAPSRSGSQILVSTERIPSPTPHSYGTSPAVPPLPQSPRHEMPAPSPSPRSPATQSPARALGEASTPRDSTSPEVRLAREILRSNEPLRIASLEVADLKVDRLTVSQLDAHKICASEVDAVVVSASEMANVAGESESTLHPSLLRELMAIRSHLESVAASKSSEKVAVVAAASPTADAETKPLVERIEERAESVNKSPEESPERPAERETTAPEKPKRKHFNGGKKESADVKVEETTIEKTTIVQDVPDETPESLRAEFLRIHDVASDPDAKIEQTRTASPPIFVPDQSLSPPEETQRDAWGEIAPEARSTTKSPNAIEERPRSRSGSRSRSPSPSGDRPVRQTASPLRSLPPAISVTLDTPDSSTPSRIVHSEVFPQRAVVSYTESINEQCQKESSQREESQSPLPPNAPTFVAFPTSQIPAQFFSLVPSVGSRVEPEPSIVDTTQQLLRALRVAGTRAMRHFVGYVASRVSSEESTEKLREVELALCALLLLVAGLLILCFGSPRTVTHHYHWDYFNPPQ